MSGHEGAPQHGGDASRWSRFLVGAALAALGCSTEESKGRKEGPAPRPVVLSVMGDVPYGFGDRVTLDEHIAELNAEARDDFVVHVGDIKPGAGACIEQTYERVADQLGALQMPTFVLPGDNEWNDCSDVDAAWALWQEHLARFEERWPDAPVVDRQEGRAENFAWTERGVLFIGLALPGGLVWDSDAWAAILDDGASWVEQRLAATEASAAVILAHAGPGDDRAPFFERFESAVSGYGRPVLLVHGDGHRFIDDQPWPATTARRIQVAQGGDERPLRLIVDPGGSTPFGVERDPDA